ncbi:non-hydrolyzing UDP-N-acetylglucosamine 2-epimerase [Rhodosalinus sp. K401]|uniref:non-hydrolyzing UDP-N-acetylglucosamine 2-epimerase n=1 Tax=Rhodosalinus sp. K401 TaxID=3239195 RepID=UPI00352385F3
MAGGSRIDCVVGARPNFVKMAPILRALRAEGIFAPRLLHTGQHYDPEMDAVFFEELGLPRPDVHLGAGGGTQTVQTARIMERLDAAFATDRPALVLVVGDVTSTLAAALVAAQHRIPLAHVEAGLRSGDRAMPEEINRLVTDRLSDLLLTTERAAQGRLEAEGVCRTRIRFVGNVMIDTLCEALPRTRPAAETIAAQDGAGRFGSAWRAGFGVVTLHRPSNVDDPARLSSGLAALEGIAARLPLVWPLHPRTRARLAETALLPRLEGCKGLLVTPPLGYLSMLGLLREARLAITDSGGVQEETTALGVPCLTLRDSTERPVTIAEGTNTLLGTDPAALGPAVARALAGGAGPVRRPELWDGRAAPRVARAVRDFLIPA